MTPFQRGPFWRESNLVQITMCAIWGSLSDAHFFELKVLIMSSCRF